jgi:hypothetical protein
MLLQFAGSPQTKRSAIGSSICSTSNLKEVTLDKENSIDIKAYNLKKKEGAIFFRFWVTISVCCPKLYNNCSLLTLDIQNKKDMIFIQFLHRNECLARKKVVTKNKTATADSIASEI